MSHVASREHGVKRPPPVPPVTLVPPVPPVTLVPPEPPVTLVPPDPMGAKPVVLQSRQGGRTVNLRRSFDAVDAPGLAAFAGKVAKGNWVLEVRDEARLDGGQIRLFGLTLRLHED